MTFEVYHVPRVFDAEEITTIPWSVPKQPELWHWLHNIEPSASLGDFLVREYIISSDEWEYKVVRRENFLEFYQKGNGKHAKQISEASSHDGGGRPQSSIRQEDGHSDARSAGIQSGGRGKAQGKTLQQEIAVAYACTVDGWVQVPARAIRNSESPHLVWMLKSTWDSLATHADIRGLFFIPCETAPDAQQLRMLVNAQEIADAS